MHDIHLYFMKLFKCRIPLTKIQRQSYHNGEVNLRNDKRSSNDVSQFSRNKIYLTNFDDVRIFAVFVQFI